MGILRGSCRGCRELGAAGEIGFMVSGFYRDPGLRQPKGAVLGPLSKGILQLETGRGGEPPPMIF